MSNDAGAPVQDAVVEEYSRLAETYDSKWSRYVEATVRETLARLPAKPESVLDVGCGTGALLDNLRRLHPRAQLFGIDPVPAMLGIARRRLHGAAELREGWADRLPYDDARFDLVVSSNMFHYIASPEIALQEMRRVLRPGGSLVLTDWCDDFLACRVCGWYLRLSDRAFVRTYRTGECLELLNHAGFGQVEIERYKITWLWGLMTARAIR